MTASPIPWAAVEQAIVTWVSVGANGIPVIWSGQNKARPPAPYIALRLRGLKRVANNFVNVDDNPLVFAPKSIASVAAGALGIPAHGLALGDGPVRGATTGALPGGLALATDYWAAPVDADHLKLAASFALARAGTTIAVTPGTGSSTIVSTPDTRTAGAEILFTAGGYVDLTLSMQCFAAPGPTGATGVTGAMQTLDQVIAAYMLPSRHDALNEAGVTVYDFGTVTPLDAVINSSVFEPRAVVDVKLYLDSNLSETGTIIEFVEIQDQARDTTFEVDS